MRCVVFVFIFFFRHTTKEEIDVAGGAIVQEVEKMLAATVKR